MKKQVLELPRCKKCGHVQISLLRHYFEKCECGGELEKKKFKEV